MKKPKKKSGKCAITDRWLFTWRGPFLPSQSSTLSISTKKRRNWTMTSKTKSNLVFERHFQVSIGWQWPWIWLQYKKILRNTIDSTIFCNDVQYIHKSCNIPLAQFGPRRYPKCRGISFGQIVYVELLFLFFFFVIKRHSKKSVSDLPVQQCWR